MSTTLCEHGRPFSVLIGSDLAPSSGDAFDQALRVTRRISECELHVVHVVRGESTEQRTREVVDELRTQIQRRAGAHGGMVGLSAGIHVRAGEPVREIVQLAVELGVDLLVIGPHERADLKTLFGASLAARLATLAPCPVVVARHHSDNVEKLEPAIEPPCPDCLHVRRESAGTEWWCARHLVRGRRAHVYSYQDELPFGQHDSSVTPTGIDLAT